MNLTQEQLCSIAKDPRNFMEQAYWCDVRIAVKRERIESLRKLAESITIELKSDVCCGTGEPRLMENCVCSVVDLQSEIESEVKELVELQRAVSYAIKDLVDDKTLQTVLELRYLNLTSWEEVSQQMGYARRWVYRLHKKSLTYMQEAARSALALC